MTKTIILGIIIAGIIGAGITAAYAGSNIKLAGQVDVDGNKITNLAEPTELTDAATMGTLNNALGSDLPTQPGPPLASKLIIYNDPVDGLSVNILNGTDNFSLIAEQNFGINATFNDIVLSGDKIILTYTDKLGAIHPIQILNNGTVLGAAAGSWLGDFIKQIDIANPSTSTNLQKVSMTPISVMPGNTASADVDCPAGTEVVSAVAYANDASTGDRLFFEDGVFVFADPYNDGIGIGTRITIDNSGGSVEVEGNATTVCGNLPEPP